MPPAAPVLPRFVKRRVEAGLREFLEGSGVPQVDFAHPFGEPALAAPDSVSWRVFRNPVALFVGGVAAVLLELAEPRVRTGVWEHTSFRTDPLPRLRRTGMAAMVTVYAARSTAERMIAGVRARHGLVAGVTPAGEPYRADDPELLAWVHATASFGFLEAYRAYVRPVAAADRDRFYAEGAPAAALYGASATPRSEAEVFALFEAMRPRLERSEIVFEFLDILRRTPILPAPLRSLQGLLIRAAVELVPAKVRSILGLGRAWRLSAPERRVVEILGRIADAVEIEAAPWTQARRRLDLTPAENAKGPREGA